MIRQYRFLCCLFLNTLIICGFSEWQWCPINDGWCRIDEDYIKSVKPLQSSFNFPDCFTLRFERYKKSVTKKSKADPDQRDYSINFYSPSVHQYVLNYKTGEKVKLTSKQKKGIKDAMNRDRQDGLMIETIAGTFTLPKEPELRDIKKGHIDSFLAALAGEFMRKFFPRYTITADSIITAGTLGFNQKHVITIDFVKEDKEKKEEGADEEGEKEGEKEEEEEMRKKKEKEEEEIRIIRERNQRMLAENVIEVKVVPVIEAAGVKMNAQGPDIDPPPSPPRKALPGPETPRKTLPADSDDQAAHAPPLRPMGRRMMNQDEVTEYSAAPQFIDWYAMIVTAMFVMAATLMSFFYLII